MTKPEQAGPGRGDDGEPAATGADGLARRSTVPVRSADSRLAFVALAALCAVCVAIGFVLGRTL